MSNTPELEIRYQESEFDEPNTNKFGKPIRTKGNKYTKRSTSKPKRMAEQKIKVDPLDEEHLMSDPEIKPTQTKPPNKIVNVVASSPEESEDEEVTEEQKTKLEDGEDNSSSEDNQSSSTDSEQERKRKKKKRKRSKQEKTKKHK